MTTPLTQPEATILMHRGEVADVDVPGRMPGGDISATFNFNIYGDTGDPEKLGRAVRAEMQAWLRNNPDGIRSGIVRTGQRG
jgi:hypothetical protein